MKRASRTDEGAVPRRRSAGAAARIVWTLAVLPIVSSLPALRVAPAQATPVREEARYVEGMVVVRFVDAATEADRARLFEDLGAYDIHALPWKGFFAASISRGTTAEAVARWEKSPTVASIEPNGIVYANGPVPEDPEFPKQWHLRNVGQATTAGVGTPGADIDAPRAWCVSRGDPRVVVAVLDTGVRYDHPDLAASIFRNPGEIPGNGVDDDHNGKIDDVRGWDFEDHLVTGGDNDPRDTHGHGTLVAGVIAAAEDGQGAVGVAPGVTILPIRVLTDTNTSPPSGTHLQAALGIRYAVEMGARVINCSFGSSQPSGLVEAAILDARTEQIMVVCGAGNSASDNDEHPFYPASFPYENVISVTATDPNDQFAESFANFGLSSVDLAAPGVAVWGPIYRASDPFDRYGSSSGTSFAAPQVSGALALFESFAPGLEHPTSREALLGTVDWQPSLTGTSVTAGRLNVHRMLVSVASPDPGPPATVGDLHVAEAGSYWIDLEWIAPGDDAYAGQACCYDLRQSSEPIGPGFAAADEIRAPAPAPGGSIQRFRVEGLDADTEYHFALRTRDEAFGESATSNEIAVTTLPAAIVVSPRSVELAAKTGQVDQFVVQLVNPSGGTLDYDISVEGDWMSVSPLAGSIPAGESEELQVAWDASGLPGLAVHGALEIASNAPGAPIVRVAVTLDVDSAPEIEVSPLVLDLGTPFVGHGVHAPVTVRNLGFVTLVVNDIEADLAGLSASPASFSLGPGAEREILVTHVPDAAGFASGTLRMWSTDPFASPMDISVTSDAVAPPVLDLSASSVTAVGITGLATEPVPLIVRNLQVDGPDLELSLAVEDAAAGAAPRAAPVWLTLEPAQVTVAPGGETEVLLHFNTSDIDPGLFTAHVEISSNDPDRTQVDLPVEFDVGGVAGLLFEAEAGAFGTTLAGAFTERVLPIANAGNDTLDVQVKLRGPFAAGPLELHVPPGETGVIRVRYRPQGDARDAAMLRLVTNDPNRPLAVLPLTGQGRVTWNWSGAVRLDRDLEVPQGQVLTLEPGTLVEAHAPLGSAGIAPPTALRILGRLVVSGTEDEPVELGTNESAEWEGVIISGQAEFRHAVVSGADTGLRVTAGADVDVACSRIVGNDVGLDYAAAGAATLRVSDTRLANRITNLRVDAAGGLAVHGVVFVASGDPGGGWNVDVPLPLESLRLDGNAWVDPDGVLWGRGDVGFIQATIRGLTSGEANVLPFLEALPLPCGVSPPLPPEVELPPAFSFARRIPNPIRSDVTLDYDLPAGFLGRVVVDIFDVRGARIRRLEKYTYPGRHSTVWTLDSDAGRPVATGVYFLRFEAAGFASTRKVLVLR